MRRLRWISSSRLNTGSRSSICARCSLAKPPGRSEDQVGAVDLAVAEGDRQRDVVGQALRRAARRTAGRRTRRPARSSRWRTAPAPSNRTRIGLLLEQRRSARCRARRGTLDLARAALPVEADAEQLGVQGADVERGAARAAGRASSSRTHSCREQGPARRAAGGRRRSASRGPAPAGAARRSRPPRPPARRHVRRRCRRALLELAEPARAAAVSAWVV